MARYTSYMLKRGVIIIVIIIITAFPVKAHTFHSYLFIKISIQCFSIKYLERDFMGQQRNWSCLGCVICYIAF